MKNLFSTIQINSHSFEGFSEEFDRILQESILQRFLYCFGIIEINYKPTLHKKLIVKFGNESVELTLPHNRKHVSLERYRYLTSPLIKEFKSKISYLKKYKSLNGFKGDSPPSKNSENFNAKKIFETIEYYLSESKKNSTPIIYTGMTT